MAEPESDLESDDPPELLLEEELESDAELDELPEEDPESDEDPDDPLDAPLEEDPESDAEFDDPLDELLDEDPESDFEPDDPPDELLDELLEVDPELDVDSVELPEDPDSVDSPTAAILPNNIVIRIAMSSNRTTASLLLLWSLLRFRISIHLRSWFFKLSILINQLYLKTYAILSYRFRWDEWKITFAAIFLHLSPGTASDQ